MTQGKLRTAILIIYMFLIAVIPPTAFVLSQNFRSTSSAKSTKTYNQTVTKPLSLPSPSGSDSSIFSDSGSGNQTGSGGNSSFSPGPEVNFGPTLNFKIKIQARPGDDQSSRMFVGIAQGEPTINPTYLLSFTVDVPKSGGYSGLSLAGLTTGTTYTAYLKGKVQISSSSAFLMRPAETDLNNGQVLNLITGDLNDDNVINNADYDIEKSYLNTTTSSSNWFGDGDFNKDRSINLIDLQVIRNNMSLVGSTGPWVSTPSTKSGSLVSPPGVGSPSAKLNLIPGGYWIWVP